MVILPSQMQVSNYPWQLKMDYPQPNSENNNKQQSAHPHYMKPTKQAENNRHVKMEYDS